MEGLNYQAAFGAVLTQRLKEAGSPEWLAEVRRRAFERFAAQGFPTTHDEAWRYTNLARLATIPARVGGDGIGDAAQALAAHRISAAAAEIVLVNGRFVAELSRIPKVEGLEVKRLASAWGELEGKLGSTDGEELAPAAFPSLNTALMEDGAFVRLAPGVRLAGLVHVIAFHTAKATPAITFPRTFIRVENGAELTVVETFAGEGQGDATSAVTEAQLGENAGLDYYCVQREAPGAFHFARLEVHQERDSRFRSYALALGGATARHEITVRLAAENSHCTLNGLFAARGDQHCDVYTTIEHRVPHTSSEELYKGILADRAVGVFHGRIKVDPDAQATDARQTNKNLLLSKEATINTKPQLEIFANDVKCSHGAAIGQIEEEALFYLRSRGIDTETARGILTYAFAADILSQIRVAPLRASLEKWFTTQWRVGRGMGGEG